MGFGNLLSNLEGMIPGALQNAPQEGLASALTHAFNSDQTPPFGQMVGNLFGQSNDTQKAGILNQLLAAAPQLMQSGALGNLAGVLGGASQVTPEQAAQVDPATVQQIAEHAQTHNPSVVEMASSFYAQHPTLVQGLGAAALGLVMSHLQKK
jgi:hypothetical protein